jgi:hypothetical protein
MNTKFCLINGAHVNEIQDMGATARNMANSVATDCKGNTITLPDREISTAFLNRVAEHLYRYELIFLDGDQIFTNEEIKAPFMSSLSDTERESLMTCIGILVGQGRIELCCPFNADEDSPEKSADELVKNKRWVPYTFIERVQAELDKIVVGLTGLRMSEDALFSVEFLQSLTRDEREMLMPCTLKMVMAGAINFPVIELADDEEAEDAAVAS